MFGIRQGHGCPREGKGMTGAGNDLWVWSERQAFARLERAELVAAEAPVRHGRRQAPGGLVDPF